MHVTHRTVRTLSLALLATVVLAMPTFAQSIVEVLPTARFTAVGDDAEFVPGEILVKFRETTSLSAAEDVHRALGTEVIYTSPYAGFQRVRIAPDQDEITMVETFSLFEEVEYAELNSICRAAGVPTRAGAVRGRRRRDRRCRSWSR